MEPVPHLARLSCRAVLLCLTLAILSTSSLHAAAPTLTGVDLIVKVDDIGTFYNNGTPIYNYPIGTWSSEITVPIDPAAFSNCSNVLAIKNENVNTCIGTMFMFIFSYSDGSSWCYSAQDAFNDGAIKMYNQRSDLGDPDPPPGWFEPAFDDSAWGTPGGLVDGSGTNYSITSPCDATVHYGITPYAGGSCSGQCACEKAHYRIQFPAVPNGASVCTEMTLAKTPSSTSLTCGDPITFTFDLENIGSIGAENLVLTDLVPPYISFVSADNGGTLSGNEVIWNLPTPLAAGANMTVSWTGVVEAYVGTIAGTTADLVGDNIAQENAASSDLTVACALPTATPTPTPSTCAYHYLNNSTLLSNGASWEGDSYNSWATAPPEINLANGSGGTGHNFQAMVWSVQDPPPGPLPGTVARIMVDITWMASAGARLDFDFNTSDATSLGLIPPSGAVTTESGYTFTATGSWQTDSIDLAPYKASWTALDLAGLAMLFHSTGGAMAIDQVTVAVEYVNCLYSPTPSFTPTETPCGGGGTETVYASSSISGSWDDTTGLDSCVDGDSVAGFASDNGWWEVADGSGSGTISSVQVNVTWAGGGTRAAGGNALEFDYSVDGSTTGILGTPQNWPSVFAAPNPQTDSLVLSPPGGWDWTKLNAMRVYLRNDSSSGAGSNQDVVQCVEVVVTLAGGGGCGTPTMTATPTPLICAPIAYNTGMESATGGAFSSDAASYGNWFLLTGDPGCSYRDTSVQRSGAASLRLQRGGACGGNQFWVQNIGCPDASCRYTLCAWMQTTTAPAAGFYVSIEQFDAGGNKVGNPSVARGDLIYGISDSTWTQFCVTIGDSTSPYDPSMDHLRLVFGMESSDTGYMDDVTVTENCATLTPTPTASPTATATYSATPSSSATPTVTFTHTPTITLTATPTLTATQSPTPTATPTVTFTRTPTPSQTPTATATSTPTATPTATATPSATPSPSPSFSPTGTPTATQSPTPTATPSNSPTRTATPSETPTVTRTVTPTVTPSATETLTATQSQTETYSPTATPSGTPTLTATQSQTETYSPTGTATRTATPSETPTVTRTVTPTATPSATETLTATQTQTETFSPTSTSTATQTLTATQSQTETASPTQSRTQTPTPSSTATDTFTASPTRTVTPTASPSETPTVTRSSTPTASHTPSASPTATPSATPTDSPTISPTHTDTPPFTPTISPTDSPTPTATPSATITLTPTPTSSPTATPTASVSATPTASSSATASASPSASPSATPSLTATHTPTITPSRSPSHTPTATPTATATPSASPTATPSATPSRSATASVTPTPTPSLTASPSATQSQTPSFTATASPTQSITLTPTPSTTPTDTTTASATATMSPSATSSPTATFTFTATPTATPTLYLSPTPTYTITPSFTASPTFTHSPTVTQTVTPVVGPLIKIHGIYPNPFVEEAKVFFVLKRASQVSIKIFNVAGEVIYEEDVGVKAKGANIHVWKGVNRSNARVASGVYPMVLRALALNGEQGDFWEFAVVSR